MPGSGRIDHVDFKSIQDKIKTADHTVKQIYQERNPNKGYGGKYGTDQVMDKVAQTSLFFLLLSMKLDFSPRRIFLIEQMWKNIPHKQVRREIIQSLDHML